MIATVKAIDLLLNPVVGISFTYNVTGPDGDATNPIFPSPPSKSIVTEVAVPTLTSSATDLNLDTVGTKVDTVVIPTIMFGVPVNPCALVAVSALPVRLPVTLPVRLPVTLPVTAPEN